MPDEVEDLATPGCAGVDDDLAIRRAVHRALRGLPERQRAALVLVHFHGLSGREAAGALGTSEEALESLLARPGDGSGKCSRPMSKTFWNLFHDNGKRDF